MLLLSVSLVATTVATYLLLAHGAQTRIADELQHEVDEFNALPPGPTTVAARLRTATARAVPEAEIVLVSLLDGRPYTASGGRDAVALGLNSEILATLTTARHPARGQLTVLGQSARYVALPVTVPGDTHRGTFITLVLPGPLRRAIWSSTRLQLEVGAAALLLASLLAWVAAGRVLRPVRATTNLARTITDTDLAGRLPVTGTDEVSQMAATFNAMLDRLENAVAAQRRFLADAGHELRTPITIIQGNLDTLTAADPDDVETLNVITDELTRMTRLVDELSLLAASERPDFLRPTPTDLELLAQTLVAKAHALGDRGWAVTSDLHGWALLDAQRITQAVMQLAANAVAHTADGTPVDLHLTQRGDQLSFTVADHGPGIPAADRARVFDRFTRLDHRHAERTGLGLAIVAAIAAAHGGRVRLTDTPGGGATFTLTVGYRPTEPSHDTRPTSPVRIRAVSS